MLKQKIHNTHIVLQRVTSGDEAAFKGLYETYWKEIYSLALAYLKSPEWAEDVLQEVFIKLWLKRESLPKINHFESWLFILARNELVSALRNKASQSTRYVRYLREQTAQPSLPASRLDPADLERMIQDSLKQLSSRQRKIYSLSREDGKSPEEIAIDLGLSRKTVSNTLSIVLGHIRSYLLRNKALHIGYWLGISFFVTG